MKIHTTVDIAIEKICFFCHVLKMFALNFNVGVNNKYPVGQMVA